MQRACGSLLLVASHAVGAVGAPQPLQYALPAYALPALGGGGGGGASTAAVAAAQHRARLLGAARGLVLVVHACLRPAVAPPDGAAAPVPLQMLSEVAFALLAVDGAVPLHAAAAAAAASDGALPRGAALAALPAMHTLALQLLHSTFRAAGRHALGLCSAAADAVQLSWRRTDAAAAADANAPPPLRDARLRAAAYALSIELLELFGGGGGARPRRRPRRRRARRPSAAGRRRRRRPRRRPRL